MSAENQRPRIVVIDSGIGNWRSVQKALEHTGATAPRTYDPQEILSAEGLVLPGVGAFPEAMKRLAERDLVDTIKRFKDLGRPVLGICLGHQLLFEASEEQSYTEGLGFLPGVVRKATAEGVGGINIGWRHVAFTRTTPLWDESRAETFYHLHGFAVETDDQSVIFARSQFAPVTTGIKPVWVASGAQKDNLYGVQFHPEKSHKYPGLKMIGNFVELCRDGMAGL
jgi:glutamine amidotransferase